MLHFLFLLAYALAASHALSVSGPLEKPKPSLGDVELELKEPTLEKRSGKIYQEKIYLRSDSYIMKMWFGTPKKSTEAILDTGMDMIHVFTNLYDPKKLKTAKEVGDTTIAQSEGEDVAVKLYKDSITMPGGATMNAEFGRVMAKTDPPLSIVGLADGHNKYRSLPWILKEGNYIKRAQYSFYMDQKTKEGKIIFGGIDKNKIQGSLVKNPVIERSNIAELNYLQSAQGKYVMSNLHLEIDTGSKQTTLDEREYDWLAERMKVKPQNGKNYVDCKLSSTKSILWKLKSGSFKIPYSAFVKKEGTKCVFVPKKGTENILGFDLLKYLYISIDYEDMSIAIANFKSSSKAKVVEAT